MSARGAIRRLALDALPWLERLGLTAGGDLEVKSATGRVNVACDDDGPAAHRVGDLGDGGTISSPAPGQLTYTAPNGNAWNITLTSAAPGSPVVIAIIPVIGDAGKIITKAMSGSERVKVG